MESKEQIKARESAPYLCEVGVSGVKRYGGYIYEDFLTQLQGKRGAQVYREMMANESIIGAAMWIFRTLLVQTPWYLEAVDDSPQAELVRDHVESCLYDFDGGMQALIGRALTAFGYGYALCEKVFKIRRGPDFPEPFRSQHSDGRWGIAKLPLRKQTTIEEWIYDDNTGDTLIGAIQIADNEARRRILPISKLLHFRFRSVTESPEGESGLRQAYPSYYAVKHARFVESVGIERYMVGIPVVTVPPQVLEASAGTREAATRTSFEALVRNICKDNQAGVVFPAREDASGKKTGYDIFLLSGGGDKPTDIDPVIQRYESRIAMSMLAGVMLLGQQNSVGSFALSKDQSELMVLGLTSLLDSIHATVQEQLLPDLVVLNGWDASLTPKLKHGPVKAPNIADLASFLSAASGSGAFVAGDKAEAWVRDKLGMELEDRPSFTARDAVLNTEPSITDRSTSEQQETAPQEDVQKQVLNGAQVTALADVVQRVAAGVLPRNSAVGIISVGFRLSEDEANRLLGDAGTVINQEAKDAI